MSPLALWYLKADFDKLQIASKSHLLLQTFLFHPFYFQIKLWEMERERLEFTEGVLYKDFMSLHDFSLLSNYASSNGVLIYSDERQRTMVVTKKGHPSIKTFWKEEQSK